MSAERTIKNVAVCKEAIFNAADSIGIEVEDYGEEVNIKLSNSSYGVVTFTEDKDTGMYNIKYDSMYEREAKRVIDIVKFEDTVLKVAKHVNSNNVLLPNYNNYYLDNEEIVAEITY